MAEQLVIEAPDFDSIEKQAKRATRDAIYLLWSVLNNEILTRRKTVRDAKQTLEVKATNAGPTTQQDNYDTDRSTIHYFTGASGFNLTGLRNGVEGSMVILHNTGAGTVTIKNASGSSDAANQFTTSTGADLSLTTSQFVLCCYLNARWRAIKL